MLGCTLVVRFMGINAKMSASLVVCRQRAVKLGGVTARQFCRQCSLWRRFFIG